MTDQQMEFFSRLNSLDTGARAALRKNAGTILQQADGNAISVFFSCLPGTLSEWQEERWFAIACLQCMYDPFSGETKPIETIIGNSLRNDELSDSTKHRIESLLDTKWDSDGYLLTKLVRLMKMMIQKSDPNHIDFASLLDDLLGWNSDSQYVQRKWARTIFSKNA